MIIDLGRVEPRDRNGREEIGQETRTRLGKLVEDKRAARDLGEDGKQPGTGGRLKHPVGRRYGGRRDDCETQRDRCRELL